MTLFAATNVLAAVAIAADVRMILDDAAGRTAAESSEEPVTTGAPATVHGVTFLRHFESDGIEIYSDSVNPVEAAKIVNNSLERAGAFLLNNKKSRPKTLQIFLCGDIHKLCDIEEAVGLPRSDRMANRTFEYRGGFYESRNIILLPADSLDDIAWTLTHEIVHVVYASSFTKGGGPIDEGLAEILPHWIVREPANPSPRECAARFLLYEERLHRAVKNGELPSIPELLAKDYWQFRDARSGWLGFACAWSFVKLLVESRDEAIAGRFPQLLQKLKSTSDHYAAICDIYDITKLSKLWRESIERGLREGFDGGITTVFGSWERAGSGLVARFETNGSALALLPETPGEKDLLQAEFVLDGPVPQGARIGFIINFDDSKHFDLVALRPDGFVFQGKLRKGRWENEVWEKITNNTDKNSLTAGSHWKLESGADLSVKLIFPDGREFPCEHLKRKNGRVGVWAEIRVPEEPGPPRGKRSTADKPAAVEIRMNPVRVSLQNYDINTDTGMDIKDKIQKDIQNESGPDTKNRVK